ncbi:MAG: 4Fe-4S dicluster domain-containing protein [Planctomycetota bacterium]
MTRILDKAEVVVSPEHCKGCGLCIEVCPKDVLFLRPEFNSAGYHPADYRGVNCNGCGFCFYACPEPAAITVYKKGAEVDSGEAA